MRHSKFCINDSHRRSNSSKDKVFLFFLDILRNSTQSQGSMGLKDVCEIRKIFDFLLTYTFLRFLLLTVGAVLVAWSFFLLGHLLFPYSLLFYIENALRV